MSHDICPHCGRTLEIGLLVEGNAYFGDAARYRGMSHEQLQDELARIDAEARDVYRAFICHRTVPWFIGAMAVLGVVSFFRLAPPSVVGMWIAGAVLPVTLWMRSERRALALAQDMLKKERSAVEACMAVWKARESSKQVGLPEKFLRRVLAR